MRKEGRDGRSEESIPSNVVQESARGADTADVEGIAAGNTVFIGEWLETFLLNSC